MLLLCHLTRSCLACGTIWKCLVSLSSSLEACNSLCKWKCTIFREPFECSCLINEGKIRRGPQCRRETDLHQGWQVFFLYPYLHVDPEYRFFPSFLMFIQIYGVLSALSIFSRHDSKGPDSGSCWVPSVPTDGTPQHRVAWVDTNKQETAKYPTTFHSVLQTVLERGWNRWLNETTLTIPCSFLGLGLPLASRAVTNSTSASASA